MTLAQRVARCLGYDLIPRAKARLLQAQLIAVLARFGISCVLDVGANAGQYGLTLRELGYCGRIVSFATLVLPWLMSCAPERMSTKEVDLFCCA